MATDQDRLARQLRILDRALLVFLCAVALAVVAVVVSGVWGVVF